ncbi:hypothetical protein G9A89_004718 [Geosiphon pyriformis]|nr:hypothetical protein G9A89_004718 [Geosiphon pyriformis]
MVIGYMMAWIRDALIKKGLKLKGGLPRDFLDAALHHSLLYGLKSFEQIQAESKLAAVVMFFNALGILFPVKFLHDSGALLSGLVKANQLSGLDILTSEEFSDLYCCLHELWSGLFEIFTDGLLKRFGSFNVAGSATAYFSTIDHSIGVRVHGLMSFILAELQAVALALEYVPSSSAVTVHLDSQAAINTCVSELSHPVKGHSGVCGNIKADAAVGAATCSWFSLPIGVRKRLLIAESMVMSGNVHHFVRDLFRSVCQAHWEAGPDQDVIRSSLVKCMDWSAILRVWHPDSHMLTGFTNWKSSVLQSYLMKTVHHRLSVTVRKRLYNKNYPGVLCLLCREMELPNHVFSCSIDAGVRNEILTETAVSWVSLVDSCVLSSSAVLQFLSYCFLDVGLYSILCKGFVMGDWCSETIEVFEVKKVAVGVVVDFIRSVVELHHSKIWLVRSSYRMSIEKAGSVGDDEMISGLSHCKASVLSDSMVQIIGVLGSFFVNFGYYRSSLFFFGLDFNPWVIIGV